jgi:PAS domain S-box-containing protein
MSGKTAQQPVRSGNPRTRASDGGCTIKQQHARSDRSDSFTRRESALRLYLAAFGAVTLATGVRVLLDAYLQQTAPFLLFTLTVLIAARYGGLGPGLFATACSVIYAWYLFVEPRFAFGFTNSADATHLVVFIVVGAGISIISEGLRRSRSEIVESERRYRLLVEQVRDHAIFRTDLEGRPMTWNEGVCRVLGFEEDEFLGKDIIPVIFTAEDQASGALQRELEQAGEAGHASNDRWMKKKDGSLIWVAGVTYGIYDGGLKLTGYGMVMRDLTEQKRAEDERERLLANLESSNRELARFSYAVSHDLQAPVRNIKTLAQSLVRGSQASEGQAGPQVRLIVQAADGMQRLIEGLLKYAHAGEAQLRREVFPISTVVQAAEKTLRPLIAETQARVECGPLPTVNADRLQLEQLFQNLLDNAIKYRRKDVSPAITISAEPLEGGWQFTVEDNGKGIPPEHVKTIFEPLSRLHGREVQGTGLGLALCRTIVERHGGHIWVESEPGSGSKFFFTVLAA